MKKKALLLLIFLFICVVILVGCSNVSVIDNIDSNVISDSNSSIDEHIQNDDSIKEDGKYSSPEDVAEYLHIYGKLPSNFITKKEAQALGWESDEGNLWEVTDNMSIGGDAFGNREKKLPDSSGRKWYECDVNYMGGFRGAERVVYSNDGLIYYSDDHYKTFTQLY